MQIADILPASRVAIDVPALSKKAALEELARLVATDTPNLTPAQAFDGLIARERLGSTGLGNGIAIPHGRIAHLQAMQGAFLRTATPIDFDAVDGEPVDLFFALFVPKDTTAEHNDTLAKLARLFVDEKLVRELREQASAETVHRLLIGK
jgi:PTS system nitrogen regulatory IIA component